MTMNKRGMQKLILKPASDERSGIIWRSTFLFPEESKIFPPDSQTNTFSELPLSLTLWDITFEPQLHSEWACRNPNRHCASFFVMNKLLFSYSFFTAALYYKHFNNNDSLSVSYPT
ncbi:hypothetical protein CEXT_109271 [Caerostris extrusa]|uniref:Uncharacterized protein n=1 Tax=Caerostris extrusa TaxID=172846 RepID=A0AAV4UH16_CAEEX|nr:hypothetical protein CEXT_109271 [Caerostris extrusa]